jgi:hypothetical protein
MTEETKACRWCGDDHGPRCPWVKALQFSPAYASVVTRVEFFSPRDLLANEEGSADDGEDYPRLKPMKG